MSDRTSAGLFRRFFRYLAADPTPQSIAFAKGLWAWARDYDFSHSQMDCDDALITLRLAKRGPNEDGDEVTLYLGDDYEDAS